MAAQPFTYRLTYLLNEKVLRTENVVCDRTNLLEFIGIIIGIIYWNFLEFILKVN